MPLAHSAWRPQPVVELLKTKPVTIEEATKGLGSFLEKEYDDFDQSAAGDNSFIKIKQLPGAHDKLRLDWGQFLDGERPADCFVEVSARLEVHMSPFFLGPKLNQGLRGAVMALLLQYNSILDCVPMTFSKLRPVGNRAALLNESPYVHFLVQFHSIGFAPSARHWLIGRTGSIQTAKGIGVTIGNLFNALVPGNSVPEGLRFDKERQAWVDREGRALIKDSLAWFLVHKVKTSAGFVNLEGSLKWDPSLVGGVSAPASSGKKGSGKKGKVKKEPASLEPEEGGSKKRSKKVAEEAQEVVAPEPEDGGKNKHSKRAAEERQSKKRKKGGADE